MININTNAAATAATYNLDRTNENLKRSLTRLSSGLRINSAFDDAGGLAVSMKLAAAIRRTDAASANVGNSLSFLQTQDGVLKTAGSILERMSELATLATDATKTTDDRALYDTEFTELEEEMTSLLDEEFNGIPLFADPAGTLTLRTSENGGQTMGITQVDLQDIQNAIVVAGGGLSVATESNATAAVAALNTQIQALAVLRARNGAEQSRVTYAQDILAVNRNNLEAANSQILDVDIAKESTEFAKQTILARAGVAMLAQANLSSEVTLRLLE
jgi:flagellin